MPLINKIESGKILEDNFDDAALNPVWQPSPSDPTRYSVNTERPGYLRLKHGDTPLYILMDMPNRDFVLELKNDYQPTVDRDNGGVVVYRDNQSRIELLEYFDTVSQSSVNYTHMRISRKQNMFTGYGSKDGGNTWEIIGASAADDMSKVGLVLNHDSSVAGSVPMDVDYVKVFSDTRLSIGNLTPGMEVKLYDEQGNEVGHGTCPPNSNMVYIDMTNKPAPFRGSIEVLQSGVSMERSGVEEIWGGDVYWFGLLVEVYYNSKLLSSAQETSIGHMINGEIEVSVMVKNPGTNPIPNVRITKSKYFEHFGAEWVKIAEDAGGTPAVYVDSIYLGTLNAGEERKIWIKVTKNNAGSVRLVGDRKFLLEITN